MSSLLTQLREAKSGIKREQGKSAAFVKSYNTFLSKTYNPAFQKAKDYFPKVNQSYQQYKKAYDAASRSFTREKQQLYNVYEGEKQKGAGLKSTFEQQEAALQKVYREQYQPVKQEYDRRLGAYNTAFAAGKAEGDRRYTAEVERAQSLIDTQKRTQNTAGVAAINYKRTSDYANYLSPFSHVSSLDYRGNYRHSRVLSKEDGKKVGGSYKFFGSNINFAQAHRVVTEDSIAPHGGKTSYVNLEDFGTFQEILRRKAGVQQQRVAKFQAAVDAEETAVGKARLGQELKREQDLFNIYQRSYSSQLNYAARVLQKYQGLEEKFTTEKAKTDQMRSNLETFKGTKDTYISNIQQQQAKPALDYVNQYSSTLNQASNIYNEYYNKNYQPAYQAYQNFLNTGAVSSSLSQYQNFVNNQGSYFSSRVGASQSTYEDTKSTYEGLQATYKGYEPQLEQLRTKAETSSEAYLGFKADEARLEKSVRLELDPRKRGTRVGSRRSLITSGSKRASSAR